MGNDSQILFLGRGSNGLDERVKEILKQEGLNPEIGKAEFSDFGNTETKVEILDSARGKSVIFVENFDKKNMPYSKRFNTPLSINDLLMETFLFAEAAHGSKAPETFVVMSDLVYETAFMAGMLHSQGIDRCYVLNEQGHDTYDLRQLGDWVHRRSKSHHIKAGKQFDMEIFAGSSAKEISGKICDVLSELYGQSISPITNVCSFDEETKKAMIDKNKLDVDGKEVFYVQNFYDTSSGRSTNDNLMEALLFAYYARKNGAAKITAVFPNFPYERQDKRQGREPISIKAVADLLYCAGYDQALTVSLHCEESEGAFGRLYFDNIQAAPIIYSMVKEAAKQYSDKLCVLTTDMGGAELGRDVTRMLRDNAADARVAIAGKNRPRAEQVGQTYIVGNEWLPGRYLCVVDDLLASGGSAISVSKKAYELIEEDGKEFKGISLFFVSGFFNNGALENLKGLNESGKLDGVYVANTIPHDYVGLNKAYPFIHAFDISKQIAKSVQQINTHGSVSETLENIDKIEKIV